MLSTTARLEIEIRQHDERAAGALHDSERELFEAYAALARETLARLAG